MMAAFTEQDFKKQKRQALLYVFQGGICLIIYPLIWLSLKKPIGSFLDIVMGIVYASSIMLVGLGLITYRIGCIRRACAEFPTHPLWDHETFETIMYRPDYLTIWTWKQWEKAMKESQ